MPEALPLDTEPAIHELHVAALQRLTVADRARLLDQMCHDVELLARVGIARAQPDLDEVSTLHELARRRYGDSLADAAYRHIRVSVTRGPLDLLTHLAAILDELGIAYVVGGSIASSLLAEPRTTNDVDLAVSIGPDAGARLLERVGAEFYVPHQAAQEAIRTQTSFNILDVGSALKADIFVLGPGVLDRRQIERRISISLPGGNGAIWVTAPEDQVLRKLDRFRRGGESSDRQWRDVLGILRVNAATLDGRDLRSTADEIGLTDLLHRAIHEADVRLDG